MWSGEEFAVKLTQVRDNPDILRDEKYAYDALAGGVGIPRVRWYGQECDFYARSLGFDDKPDYARLRGAFRHRFAAEEFKHDNVFDWAERLFYELQKE
jgi:hypothetical protein